MSKTIRGLIHNNGDSLTRTDQKIIRVLLENYPTSALLTIAELAELAQVSDPSILRFVKRLGFDGYPNFQQAAQHEIKDSLEGAAELGNEHSLMAPHLPDYVAGFLKRLNADLLKSVSRLQSIELLGAARMIGDESHRILSLSDSASASNLTYFHRGLFSLRSNCVQLDSDPLMRTNAIKDIGKNDVVVVFQREPFESSTVAFCQLAHERGANLIVFSDRIDNPLSAQARYVLAAPNASQSAVPVMCITELILLATGSVIGKSTQYDTVQENETSFFKYDDLKPEQ